MIYLLFLLLFNNLSIFVLLRVFVLTLTLLFFVTISYGSVSTSYFSIVISKIVFSTQSYLISLCLFLMGLDEDILTENLIDSYNPEVLKQMYDDF